MGDLIVSTEAASGSGGMFYAWGRGVAAGRKLPAMRAVDVNPTLIRGLIRVRELLKEAETDPAVTSKS